MHPPRIRRILAACRRLSLNPPWPAVGAGEPEWRAALDRSEARRDLYHRCLRRAVMLMDLHYGHGININRPLK